MSANQQHRAWLHTALQNLQGLDPLAAMYIRDRRVFIGFRKMGAHVGAIWTPGQRIYLNARYFSIASDPAEPRLHSILLHEVCHLRQGIPTALSVYGELQAWQLGFRIYHELTSEPYSSNQVELMSLPLVLDRAVLRRAQTLMQCYAGKQYRADLLPLFPWSRELRFWVTRKI